jgi:hypothetical protein
MSVQGVQLGESKKSEEAAKGSVVLLKLALLWNGK